MPCKGDEICCEESSKSTDFDTSPKASDSNGYSSDNKHSDEQPTHQPQQQSKPLTNGFHEGPKQIFIERRTHPSGISFESISPMPGEELKKDGITDMSNCRVFVSNYRIVVVTQNRHGVCSIPLLGVDSVEAFDENLKLICKDGRIFSICAETQEIAMNWYKMVTPLVCGSHKMEDVFAFKFAIACAKQRPLYLKKNASFVQNSRQYLEREFASCGFDAANWRITEVNKDFKVCATYPQYLIVPTSTTDEELSEMKRGRFFDRFPTAIWRSKQTGAVLLRSSQPEISFFGTPQEGDIKLFEAIRKVTVGEKKKKIIVIDARSYGAALANRAKGGGFEGGDSYNNTEVVFMSLPNIHACRYSFHQLRQLLNSSIDSNGYFQALNTSQWLQYLFNLIVSSQRCVEALCSEGHSVLVHCSDGWDRTTQIVSLVKIISDPNYRTFEGFERLILRDWVEFGHKFNDRNGVTSTDTNERSPVFMQFIDAVHQLWLKNPDAFEFNQRYLMKLGQHQYSGFFGTFLFNSFKELLKHNTFSAQSNVPCFESEPTNGVNGNSTQPNQNNVSLISVFDYLNKQNPTFLNPVYDSKKNGRLACPKRMWELQIWSDVYCCTDVEQIVNNPDNVCHSALGDLSIHGDNPISEKLPTVSRSQSAASLNSLTSLEQAANGIHCNGSSGNHSTPNGMNPASYVSSSYSTVSYISTRRDYPQWKTFIDCDGLSKVDIALEDRIVELQRQMAKHESNARTSSESSGKQNEHHGTTALRQRVESNDSCSMFSFDLLDDLDHQHRKKRDSTCSSNVVFDFCPQRTASDALISTLDEEELIRCENCQNHIADENSETHQKNGVKCSRCTDQIPRSSSRVVVN